MKEQNKLQEAIGEIDGDLVARAGREVGAARKKWLSVTAAVLALFVLCGALWQRGWGEPLSYAVVQATYPTMAQFPQDYEDREGREAYYADLRARYAYEGAGEDLSPFFEKITATFLAGEGENAVFSPLNIYFALCMLAESCDGQAREEILSLMGQESIESLRKQAYNIWNANYRDEGTVKNILASSLWLDEGQAYNEEAIHALRDYYYADTYQGDLDSDGVTRALVDWLNDRTGGLLTDYTKDIKIPENTLLAMASTIYYRAMWEDEFLVHNNYEDAFHAQDGDYTTTYMYDVYNSLYYEGEGFSAVFKRLRGGGTMYFLLPAEGTDPAALLQNSEALAFIAGQHGEGRDAEIRLSLPRYDVASGMDLCDGLRALGVTTCFTEAGDFSPILQDEDGAYVSKIDHAARLTLDEKGVEGAAYTLELNAGSSPSDNLTVDFKLDRPFLFVLENTDHLPLFVGTVYEP